MRPTFYKNIERFGDIAKNKLNTNEQREEMSEEEFAKNVKELASATSWSVKQAARERKTNEETQWKIYQMQKKKQNIMAGLKKELQQISNNSEYRPERCPRDGFIKQEEGELYLDHLDQKKSVKQKITFGEILTDGEWGITYYLDPSTVTKTVRKKYALEQTKRKLQDLLNDQIIIDETSSVFTDQGKKNAYEGIRQAKKESQLRFGDVAEKMVRNFFKKINIDVQDVEFELLPSNAYLDVQYKADFILYMKLSYRQRKKHEHYRAVGIDIDERQEKTEHIIKKIGIQFTTDLREGTLMHKSRQIKKVQALLRENKEEIEHVEDIVLIAIPSLFITGPYKQWNNLGNPPGGPDKLWSIETKEELFKSVFKGIYTAEELEEQWRKVSANI